MPPLSFNMPPRVQQMQLVEGSYASDASRIPPSSIFEWILRRGLAHINTEPHPFFSDNRDISNGWLSQNLVEYLMATPEFLRLTSLSWSSYFHLLNLRFVTVQSCANSHVMFATQEDLYIANRARLQRQEVQIQTVQAYIDVETDRLRTLTHMIRDRRRELRRLDVVVRDAPDEPRLPESERHFTFHINPRNPNPGEEEQEGDGGSETDDL